MYFILLILLVAFNICFASETDYNEDASSKAKNEKIFNDVIIQITDGQSVSLLKNTKSFDWDHLKQVESMRDEFPKIVVAIDGNEAHAKL